MTSQTSNCADEACNHAENRSDQKTLTLSILVHLSVDKCKNIMIRYFLALKIPDNSFKCSNIK